VHLVLLQLTQVGFEEKGIEKQSAGMSWALIARLWNAFHLACGLAMYALKMR
jgi:hypothetical protein